MKEAEKTEKPKKEFHSGPTLTALILALVPVLVALGLITNANRQIPFFALDPAAQFGYCYLPIAFGVFILLVLIVTFLSQMGKTIVIDNTKVFVKQGSRQYAIPWTELSFTPPARKTGLFRNFLLSDGLHFERIEALFYPRYEEMLKLVRGYAAQVKKAYHL